MIPHAVETLNDVSCTSCHGQGLAVAETPAPLIPHAEYVNCQQCHVPTADAYDGQELAANTFRGLAAPSGGARAWEGAPPTIPHSTWMRENCLACHGPLGRPGLRTSHPGRTNCVQCHGRSAALDPFDSTVGISRISGASER